MTLNQEMTHYNTMYADNAYPPGTESGCFLQNHYMKFIQSILKQISNVDVLSLGSGNGYYELKLAPFVNSIISIELSETAVQHARNRMIEKGIQNVTFIQGDARTFPTAVPGRQFDLILALGLLHHISDEDIERILSSAYSVLKPHGYFISMDPNHYRAVRLFKILVPGLIRRYHTQDERELVPQRIFQMLFNLRYQHVSIHYIDYFLNPLIWVFPRLPVPWIRVLHPFDTCLTKIPGINRFSNLFACIAKK